MNSVVSVVVQYDSENDEIIRELLANLWAVGIPAELYDKVIIMIFHEFVFHWLTSRMIEEKNTFLIIGLIFSSSF